MFREVNITMLPECNCLVCVSSVRGVSADWAGLSLTGDDVTPLTILASHWPVRQDTCLLLVIGRLV